MLDLNYRYTNKEKKEAYKKHNKIFKKAFKSDKKFHLILMSAGAGKTHGLLNSLNGKENNLILVPKIVIAQDIEQEKKDMLKSSDIGVYHSKNKKNKYKIFEEHKNVMITFANFFEMLGSENTTLLERFKSVCIDEAHLLEQYYNLNARATGLDKEVIKYFNNKDKVIFITASSENIKKDNFMTHEILYNNMKKCRVFLFKKKIPVREIFELIKYKKKHLIIVNNNDQIKDVAQKLILLGISKKDIVAVNSKSIDIKKVVKKHRVIISTSILSEGVDFQGEFFSIIDVSLHGDKNATIQNSNRDRQAKYYYHFLKVDKRKDNAINTFNKNVLHNQKTHKKSGTGKAFLPWFEEPTGLVEEKQLKGFLKEQCKFEDVYINSEVIEEKDTYDIIENTQEHKHIFNELTRTILMIKESEIKDFKDFDFIHEIRKKLFDKKEEIKEHYSTLYNEEVFDLEDFYKYYNISVRNLVKIFDYGYKNILKLEEIKNIIEHVEFEDFRVMKYDKDIRHSYFNKNYKEEYNKTLNVKNFALFHIRNNDMKEPINTGVVIDPQNVERLVKALHKEQLMTSKRNKASAKNLVDVYKTNFNIDLELIETKVKSAERQKRLKKEYSYKVLSMTFNDFVTGKVEHEKM